MSSTSAAPAKEQLLTPEFLRKLERLELLSRRALIGRLKGERRSKRKGQSVEFADYRDYVPGDDLRFLDWNIYGRLDRLFVKLFLEEEDLHFHVLVDVSDSMGFGEPSKLFRACQIAAALAFVGLLNQDRVEIHAFADDVVTSSGPLRGRRMAPRMLEFLSNLHASGRGDLTRALRRFAAAHRVPGVTLLVTDFLDKHGYEDALRYLAVSMEVHVVHVLAWEELDPPLRGELRLIDCEDGEQLEVTATKALVDHYKRRVAAYCRSIQDWCFRRGLSYVLYSTASDFEEVVLQHFRRVGLVR